MGNIFTSPQKVGLKNRLLQVGLEVLAKQVGGVEKAGIGKSSVRRVKRNGRDKLVSIRTTQDHYLAWARTDDDKEWSTLCDVDEVMVVTVDNPEEPEMARVYLFEQAEVKSRFDRAYKARKAAGYKVAGGRGLWLSMYDKEAREPVTLVGAGIAHDVEPSAVVPLQEGTRHPSPSVQPEGDLESLRPLSIAEAKQRLALTFGVEPSAIKITVEG